MPWKKKYGKYTPGSNIKIISKEEMRKLNPKFLLVLIWSFRTEIIKQEIKYLHNGIESFHTKNQSSFLNFLDWGKVGIIE